MSVTATSTCSLFLPKTLEVYGHLNLNNMIRWKKEQTVIRCCSEGASQNPRKEKNYYDLLGVSVDSNSQEIKEAYRKLQKIYHPDIAGQEGHEHSLKLNKAYKVLMAKELRTDYDESIGLMKLGLGRSYSSWKGPLRPQALFVDENACIGCRECVHHASNTFTMDETHGCARVKVQYGDDDHIIEVSVDSCPVNCIHWVHSDELPLLEFLIQPQPKQGYGIFGGGWVRPADVFMEAKSFNKNMERPEARTNHRHGEETAKAETPAQTEARRKASMEIRMGQFSLLWKWVNGILAQISDSKEKRTSSWKRKK